MKKFLIDAVVLAILGILFVPGAVLAEEPKDAEAPSAETHVLTRDAAPSTSSDAEPKEHYFSHELFSKPFSRAEVSCAGRCDANTCICAGDPDCCDLGCDICWAVIDNL